MGAFFIIRSFVNSDAQQQIADLLALIRDLTGPATRADSPAALFTGAFRALDGCIPFALGAAVMLEQNLDLYVVAREGGAALVSDRLIRKIREAIRELIPASFESTEFVMKLEEAVLPPRPATGDDLEHATSALVRIVSRTAGVVLLVRGGDPFTISEQQIVEIFAAQVAMLLGQLNAQEQIQHLANSDELTGIGNKRSFRRQLPQEVERARVYNLPLSLLMFDVDDFKEINDRFGHTFGDVVLSDLCGAVRETLRPPDHFARFGGDEFAIILPHTDVIGACAVADRILQTLRTLSIPANDDEAIRCSVSIGVADLQPQDASADDLVRHADACLYQSKRSGKNRYTARGDD